MYNTENFLMQQICGQCEVYKQVGETFRMIHENFFRDKHSQTARTVSILLNNCPIVLIENADSKIPASRLASEND